MSELKAIFADAWKDFLRYYDKKYEDYTKVRLEEGIEEKDVGYQVCWNESDLCVFLVHFFYKKLKEKGINDIAVHTRFALGVNKFDERKNDFPDKWKEAVRAVRKYKKLRPKGKAGDIDIIVTHKEKVPFELCIELKFYHYSVEDQAKYNPEHRIKTVEKDIKEGLQSVRILKEKGVTKHFLIAILDAYYHELKDKTKYRSILKLIRPYKKEGVALYYKG